MTTPLLTFCLIQITELYNIWRKHAPPSLKPKTWRGLVPADANWSRLLVVTTDQKGNAKLQTKVFAPPPPVFSAFFFWLSLV